jgi:ATP phosphoribosyltransferase regulatory subunit HisZ
MDLKKIDFFNYTERHRGERMENEELGVEFYGEEDFKAGKC